MDPEHQSETVAKTAVEKARNKRNIFVLLVLLPIVIFIFFIVGFFDDLIGVINYHRYKSRFINQLEEASSILDLEQACNNSGGTFLHVGEKDWIAILYASSHGIMTDVSILHDSKGGWFESSYHFCGHLHGLGRQRDKFSDRSREIGFESAIEEYKTRYGPGFKYIVLTSKDLDEIVGAFKDFKYFHDIEP